MLLWLLVIVCLSAVQSASPYIPTAGWTYYIEASREKNWPNCAFRFISYPDACNKIDLWNAAGSNQQFTLESAGAGDTFYLKTNCGRYLSYPSDCNEHSIDTWPQAGINQQFKFTPTNDGSPFEYFISAVGRDNCQFKWLSFPVPCTTNSPDKIDFWSAAGADQTFRIHPVRSSKPHEHPYNSDRSCPDPFVWYSNNTNRFQLVCTSDGLDLSYTTHLSRDSEFKYSGPALGGSPPPWARHSSRWAPENVQISVSGMKFDVILYADFQPSENTHRIGYVYSQKGPLPQQFNHYSPNFLNLGPSIGGDIDAHVFYDANGSKEYFLYWKTDDNNPPAAWTYTRIFAQRITFTYSGGELKLNLIGSRQQILDSTGLWWSDSWINGGSLVEGPEMIHVDGFYYLFFASGKFCEDSYKEGVARGRSPLGPFEKMKIPLLSTGIIGNAKGQKLLGPGHASYVKSSSGQWLSVWHASTHPDASCVRYPFISNLIFANGWPYIEF